MTKAYAIIYDNYCTKALQSRIEAHPDFKEKIENKPIELLEVIKTLMHDPVRAQYPMIGMTDDIARLVNIKQGENEQLLDYVKRLRDARDIAVKKIGSEVLYGYAERQTEYKNLKTEEAKKAYKSNVFEAWMAYLVIHGSDQSKYGSLTRNFTSQYSLGNNQYPVTIETAVDVLQNHRFDPKYYENQKRHREQQNRDKPNGNDGAGAASFAQKEKDKDVTCFCCGKKGHRVPQCPDKNNTPRDKWAINRAMACMQQGTTESDDVSEISDGESVKTTTSSRSGRSKKQGDQGWSGYQLHEASGSDAERQVVHKQRSVCFNSLKDVIMLDSGSSISATFMNPDLITNIKMAKKPIIMHTNAGKKAIELEGDVIGFGKV